MVRPMRDGGAAASWFFLIARDARPARRAGPIVRLPNSARRGPTKEAHRRAMTRPDGLLRSVASDQAKQAEAGNPRSPTPSGTHQGRVGRPRPPTPAPWTA